MASNRFNSMELQRELDIGTKVSNLERRAGQLERDFNDMLLAAKEMEIAVKKYVRKAVADQKSWELLEKITDSETSISEVLDHVRIFFSFVLAKLKLHRAEITDIKMLWRLLDCEGIGQCFDDVITQLGFSRQDLENMKILVALLSKMQEELERVDPVVENKEKLICKNREYCDRQSVTLKERDDPASLQRMETLGQETNKVSLQGQTVHACKQGLIGIYGNEMAENRTSLMYYEISNEGTHTGNEDRSLQNHTEIKAESQEPEYKTFSNVPDSLKSLRKNENESGSIREALKRVRFLDIEDDMKNLIRQIVCYVTKMMYE